MAVGENFVRLMSRGKINSSLKTISTVTENQEDFGRKIIQSLHLDSKSAAPDSLLQEVFSWSGGNPFLTQQLCQVIADANYFIPSGMEEVLVEKLVTERVIQNGETQVLRQYLNQIPEQLLNQTESRTRSLLQLYLQICQQGEVISHQSPEEEELINLGLVIAQENHLKVANRLYQSIFNLDWVQKQLLALEIKSATQDSLHSSEENPKEKRETNIKRTFPLPGLTFTPKETKVNQSYAIGLESHPGRKTPRPNPQSSRATRRGNQRVISIAVLMSLLGLLIISALIIFFNKAILSNNSQPQLSPEKDSLDSQSLSMSTFCLASMPSDYATQEDWRLRLEQEKQRLQEQFPENCQAKLEQLLRQLNPSNYEFYQDYQQALLSVSKLDYPQALEQLYQAAEKAIIIDKAALLLKEILKNESLIFQPLSDKSQDWEVLKAALIKAEPHDYQLSYQRAKLKLTTDHNHHHTREFQLLFAAAKKAIENQQAEMMLSQLKPG